MLNEREQTTTVSTMAAADETPRFRLVNEDQLAKFIDSADSENTKKQIKYAKSVFSEFCKETNAGDYTVMENAELDILLSKFYAGARNQKGDLYSKKTMQSIRYGIQRHFLAENGIDIVKGDFPRSQKAFKAMLSELKANGKGSVNHHSPIENDDMVRMQSILNVDTAKGLQQKVFVDAMIYFANRGMENLRQMKPEDFILHPSAKNHREFFSLRDMSTKNHPDDDDESQGGRMYTILGNARCPVNTLKKYKEKLNPDCKWMWQRPKENVREDDEVWFDNAPLGKNTLSDMTKKISVDASCSKVYTNHCLRATSVTLLDKAGYASRDIMTVSGHKSETSIKHYARTCEATKQKMSDTISSVVNQHLSDQEPESASLDLGLGLDLGGASDTAEPMSASQCEHILDEISGNPGFIRDITINSSPHHSPVSQSLNMITNQHHGQHSSFNFHGCVVNIYNK